MGRTDRRQRTALDEAYRYYNAVEAGGEPLEIYRLTKAVRTLAFALTFCDTGEFKLTRQLWKRLHQALFDKLITNFSGKIIVLDENRTALEPGATLPEAGFLDFLPDNCRRADDVNEIELVRLYPRTYNALKHVWEQRRSDTIQSGDFAGSDCDGGVCFMKPVVTGHEIMGEESRKGKDEAYSRWWELYWQAYCTANRRQQEVIMRQMSELEAVWGNLYY